MIVDGSRIFKRFRYVRKRIVSITKCCEIFGYALKLMVYDAIYNSTYIEIPMYWGNATLYVRKIKGREFIDRYKKGEFRDIDYIMSDYTANVLSMKNNSFDEVNDIELDDETARILTEMTNKGVRY